MSYYLNVINFINKIIHDILILLSFSSRKELQFSEQYIVETAMISNQCNIEVCCEKDEFKNHDISNGIETQTLGTDHSDKEKKGPDEIKNSDIYSLLLDSTIDYDLFRRELNEILIKKQRRIKRLRCVPLSHEIY